MVASLAFDVERGMAVLASGHWGHVVTGSTPRIRSARPCDRGSDGGHAGRPMHGCRRMGDTVVHTLRQLELCVLCSVLCEDALDEVSGFGEQLQPATHAMASSCSASPKTFTSPGVIQPKSMVR